MTVYINKENEILEVVCDQFATNPLEEYCLPIRFASCCNYTMTEDQKYSGLDELLYPNLQTSEEEQENTKQNLMDTIALQRSMRTKRVELVSLNFSTESMPKANIGQPQFSFSNTAQ